MIIYDNTNHKIRIRYHDSMADVVKLEVPMRVDVEMGTDWGNVK